MSFTKAFVLSETDLNIFMSDFLEDFLNGYSKDKNETEYDIYENFKNELDSWFNELLDGERMDEMVVLSNGVHEVTVGHRLADIYGEDIIIDEIINYFEIEKEDENDDQ